MPETTKIIENGFLFTSDARNQAGRFSILVKGDRIAEISNRSEVLKSILPTAEVIDAEGKVLFPGFIDAHYHGESAILQLFTALHPFIRWNKEPGVRSILEHVSQHSSVTELQKLYRVAYFSALKSGITTLVEHGLDGLEGHVVAAFESMRRADLRGLIGVHNGDQVERAKSLRHPSVRFMMGMPSEDDLTLYNLQTTLRLARDQQWPLVIHYGETRRGHEALKKNFRKSVVQVLAEFHVLEYAHLLTQLAFMEPGDVETLAKSGTTVILSPRSTLQKEADLPAIRELLANRIPIALGSDWGSTDPFENIRQFVAIAQVLGVPMPRPYELLNMHTVNAARAIGMSQDVGSLEVGKKADITFVDAKDVRLQTFLESESPASVLRVLLSALSSHHVSDVMINGEFFVRENQVMTYSEEDLIKEGREMVSLLMKLNPPVNPISLPTGERAHTLPFVPVPSSESGPFQSADEGFRIVRKENSPSSLKDKLLPLHPLKPPTVELPKSVKKTFGEEDL
ncbi:MAG: amidohydrolase family protein [Bacteroidota bacterium]